MTNIHILTVWMMSISVSSSNSSNIEFTNVTQDIILTEYGDYKSNGICSINDYIDPITNNSFFWILIQNDGIFVDIFNDKNLKQKNDDKLPYMIAADDIDNDFIVAFPNSCINKVTFDIINCYVFQNVWKYSYIECKIFYWKTQKWSNRINVTGFNQYQHFNSLTEELNLICFNDSYFILWTYFESESMENKSIKYTLIGLNGDILIGSEIFIQSFNGSNVMMIDSTDSSNSFLIEYEECFGFKCSIIGYFGYYKNKKIHYFKNKTQINLNLIENYYKPIMNVSILQKPIFLSMNKNNNCCYITMYEYGHKTKNGDQLKMNIYLNFIDFDGEQIFDHDIKVLNKSLLNVNSQLIQLKMLNNNGDGSYFMVLYNSGNTVFANIYCLYFNDNNNEYKLKKYNQWEFINGEGSIGFHGFISDENKNNILITWSEYVFPSNTYNAQIWNVQN